MFENDDKNTYPENKSPVLPTGEIVLVRRKIFATIQLYNNTLHGLSPSGGLVSPSGGFALLLCDQGLHLHR